MTIAATVKAMAEAGCSAEQIAAVVTKIDEERRARSRKGNAERQRRWRERNANNAVMQRDEALRFPLDKERSPPLPPSKENSTPSNAKQISSKSLCRRATQIDPNWGLQERNREFARNRGMSNAEIEFEAQRFRAHHAAKGSLMKDWNMAWQTWVLSPYRQQATGPPNGGSPAAVFQNMQPYRYTEEEIAERRSEGMDLFRHR